MAPVATHRLNCTQVRGSYGPWSLSLSLVLGPCPSGATCGGEAGRTGGVHIDSRYYERRGLLPNPARPSAIASSRRCRAIVRFIKLAHALGFRCEWKNCCGCAATPGTTGPHPVGRRKKSAIDHNCRLERMKRALHTLVRSCRSGATLDCPIIEALDTKGHDARSHTRRADH